MARRIVKHFVLSLLSLMLLPPAFCADMVLYNFTSTDGSPTSSPVTYRSNDGLLYGLVPGNDGSNKGCVYSLSITGTFTNVYCIPTGGPTPAANPVGAVVFDAGGNNMYFVSAGSLLSGECCGAITKLNYNTTTQVWSKVWEHDCANVATDCYKPQGMVIDIQGTPYGVSFSGGASGNGTLFKLVASTGVITILHSFAGGTTDGANPISPPVVASFVDFDSKQQTHIIGTTYNGGAHSLGIVYDYVVSVTGRAVVYKDIHDFAGGSIDAGNPLGPLYYMQGGLGLIGLSASGGVNGKGTIFQLSGAGTTAAGFDITILHSFQCVSTDGCYNTSNVQPTQGQMTADTSGNIYISTYSGGANSFSNGGTILKLTLSAGAYTESLLWSLGGSGDGLHGNGGLTLNGTTLYGTTQAGGSNNFGVVFSVPTT